MMKYTSVFPALLVGASVALTASAFAPAQAIDLTPTGGTAGNPAGQTLYQASITKANEGDSFVVDWYLAANSGQPPVPSPLSATSTWKIESFTSSQLVLAISITNTTTLTSLLTNAGITSFGVGAQPDVTGSYQQIGSVFDGISAGNGNNQTFPGGFKQIDVCVYSDNNCSASSQNPNAIGQTLVAGATDSFKLILSGSFGSTPAATLAFFPIKFQTNVGSYELAGRPVPEPITMLGLGVGTVGLGVLKRKYGKKEAKAKVAA